MEVYERGVMVSGGTGRVKYVGVIKGVHENGLYIICPAIICIEDRCYNLSDPIHELESIVGEVTTADFDLFVDIRKSSSISYIDIMKTEFMEELKRFESE